MRGAVQPFAFENWISVAGVARPVSRCSQVPSERGKKCYRGRRTVSYEGDNFANSKMDNFSLIID